MHGPIALAPLRHLLATMTQPPRPVSCYRSSTRWKSGLLVQCIGSVVRAYFKDTNTFHFDLACRIVSCATFRLVLSWGMSEGARRRGRILNTCVKSCPCISVVLVAMEMELDLSNIGSCYVVRDLAFDSPQRCHPDSTGCVCSGCSPGEGLYGSSQDLSVG